MTLRDFRIGWRLLAADPAYSAVVVLGLAVGFAVCFLLLGYVRYSFGYDGNVRDREHVYTVKIRANGFAPPLVGEGGPLPLRDVARKSGLVDEVIIAEPLHRILRVDAQVRAIDVLAVEAGFIDTFGVRTLAGDVRAALDKPDGIALTVSAAERLFGTRDAIGRVAQGPGGAVRVVAVLADPPANTTAPYSALVGVGTVLWDDANRKLKFSSMGRFGTKLYMKLHGSTSPQMLMQVLDDAINAAPMPAAIRETVTANGRPKMFEVGLTPLSDAYFDDDLRGQHALGAGPRANRHAVLGLAAVALLILALAATNYVNLATVRAVRRQREIGVQKALGAGTARIVAQCVAESLLASLLATLLGMLLARLLLPTFSDMVGRRLDGMFSWPMLATALALGAVTGIAASAWPAWVAARVRPARVLAGRGNSESTGGLWLRRGLTVLQFAAAIGLAGGTLAVAVQARFAMHAPPGFDPAPLLVLDVPGDQRDRQVQAFRSELTRLVSVDGVTATMGRIGGKDSFSNEEARRAGNAPVMMSVQDVAPDFFQVYRMQPVAGRLFDPAVDTVEASSSIVVNAVAAREFGFATPESAVGQSVEIGGGDNRKSLRIVGIAPEIRHQSLHDKPQPTVYRLSHEVTVLTVRARGNSADARRDIESLWRRHFPNAILEIGTAQSVFDRIYEEDAQLAQLLAAAACVALAMAAFGIYVLSAYSVQRRAKEIVLRRLHGAQRRHIARLLGAEFGTVLLVAAAIGLPPAVLLVARYLAGFIEISPMAWWMPALACTAAVLIALAATLRHARAALRLPPSLALRN